MKSHASKTFPLIGNLQRMLEMVAGLAGLLVFSISVSGQTQPTSPKDDTRVIEIVDWAEGLPVEYRADIQLNSIESGNIRRGRWAVQVLERLFRDASTARYTYKQKDITGNANTRSRKLDFAFSLNLDTLSIRTRTVRAMVPLRPAEARQLLEEIRLEIPSCPCTSAMVYDVSDFYAALDAVVSHTFSGTEKENGDHATLLASHIRSMSSAIQLAPMAGLIARTQLNKGQLELLTSEYARALQRVQASDRELASIERDQSLSKAIRLLAARNVGQALPVTPLVKAYRTFLIRSARPARCADIATDRNMIVEGFNQLRQEYASDETLNVLGVDDLKPARTAESAQVELVAEPTEFRGLLRRLMARRQIEARKQSEELNFAGWESDVSEFLQKVDALDPSRGKCHACVFHEKADLLFVFFDFTPSGGLKERILDRLVRFLSIDKMQDEGPLEWLFRVKLLLNLSRKPSDEQLKRIAELERQGKLLTMLPSDAGIKILEAMKRSDNYVMYLYATADELLKNEFALPPF